MAPTIQIRDLFTQMLESQYWDAARLGEWQRRQLGALLAHARVTSPFYRYRLDRVFRTDGRIDWDRWGDIPILSRADVVANFATLRSASPPPVHGPFFEAKTSGSTGDPVRVLSTHYLIQLSLAAIWRAQMWHGVDWSKTMITQLYVDSSLTRATLNPSPWGPAWLPGTQSGRNYSTPKPFTSRDLFEAMKEIRPAYVSVGTGLIPELARLNDAEGRPLRMDMFFARGSAPESYARTYTREVFGAEILDLYSSKEGGSLAHPCKEGRCFHVNDDCVLLEILDDDGHPVPEGVEGRVVITPFGLTSFPLIRYDQGDRAVRGGPCACGRGLSTIERIAGKSFDVFRHPDGRGQFGPELVAHLRPIIGARRWQVVQTGARSYEFRLPEDTAYDLARLEEFRMAAEQALFGDASVTIRFVPDLAANAAGKFREYVREWTGTP